MIFYRVLKKLLTKEDGKNGNAIHTIKQSNQHESGNELKAIASETVKKNEELSSLNPYGFQYYKEAHYWDTKHSGTYDNVTRISENILYIVSVEQPMHMELLYKRMGLLLLLVKQQKVLGLRLMRQYQKNSKNKWL